MKTAGLCQKHVIHRLTDSSHHTRFIQECVDGAVLTRRRQHAGVVLWYRMWDAVTAVLSVCVRAGMGMVFTGLGEFRLLLEAFDVRMDREMLTLWTMSSAAKGIQLFLPANATLEVQA